MDTEQDRSVPGRGRSGSVRRWVVVRDDDYEFVHVVTAKTAKEAAERDGGSVYHLRRGINVEVFEIGSSQGQFHRQYAHPDRPFNQRDEVVTKRV